MDTTKILKNIQHFHEIILPKACCSSNWNEESVTNAFLWAQYCEQMYQKFSNDPDRKKIDDLIHTISENFTDKNSSLCLEDLKRSTFALIQAFCENPGIENDIVEAVLLKIKSGETNFKQDLNDAAELDLLCFEVIEALKPITVINSDRSLYYEVKTEIFLDYLKAIVEQLTTEEQIERSLSKAFEALCENEDKMAILLHILMHRKGETTKEVQEIQEFAVSWMLLKLLSDKNDPLTHFIWKQSATKLRTIAVNHSAFYNFYSDFLVNCANMLECSSDPAGSEQKSRQISNHVTLSRDAILNHYKCLLSTDDEVCHATRENLLRLVAQRDTSIWNEILSFTA